jgi:hypothetical protein
MNGDVCLSGRDIECYLGEEESRVHALRGVSLNLVRERRKALLLVTHNRFIADACDRSMR